MFTLTAFIFLIVAVFCIGFFFAIASKNLLRLDSENLLVNIARAIFKRSGYVAAFGAGAFLTAYFEIASNPYHYYRWTDLMDAALVGEIIEDYPEIMETGRVPEDVLAWYSRMKESGQI